MANREDRNPTGPGPSSTSQGSQGTRSQQESGNLSFRCADVNPTCNWETRGRDENEIRRNVEKHGREQHNMQLNDETWNKVRGHIRTRAA